MPCSCKNQIQNTISSYQTYKNQTVNETANSLKYTSKVILTPDSNTPQPAILAEYRTPSSTHDLPYDPPAAPSDNTTILITHRLRTIIWI